MPCSWLAACVLAFIAERRAARRVLIISTSPSPLLGTPDASPAKTARAAASASEGSDFSTLLRELRRRCLRRSTPAPPSPRPPGGGRVRPRSCLYLLPRRTSRGQNVPPSGGAFRNPSRSLARSTRQGVCPDGPRPRPRGSRGACPRPGSSRPQCPASRRRSSSRLQLPSLSPQLPPEERERTDDTVTSHVRGELL